MMLNRGNLMFTNHEYNYNTRYCTKSSIVQSNRTDKTGQFVFAETFSHSKHKKGVLVPGCFLIAFKNFKMPPCKPKGTAEGQTEKKV